MMTHSPIRRVAVLGAGIMGSGIAAHLASARISVLLLDLVPSDLSELDQHNQDARNRLAKSALEKLKKVKPAAFFHPRDAEFIQVGNFEDHLQEAGACDVVIEAVREDLATKQALYKKLEPFLASHTIITSNTSGLSIEKLIEGRSESFQKRFLVTHFFNPVRYMHLLEVISGTKTDPLWIQKLAQFGENVLGKGIVFGKDTANFIANRIGIHGIFSLLQFAMDKHYTIEEVDAICGVFLGRSKSAIFRTIDLVGLDTLVAAAQTSYHQLQQDDARSLFQIPPLLENMIKKKQLGEKTGAGFYQKTDQGILAFDLNTQTYRPQQKPEISSIGKSKNKPLAERIWSLLQSEDRFALLAQHALFSTFAYASKRVGSRTEQDGNKLDPIICDDITQMDRAMCWGFNWELGPFELWDALGVEKVVGLMKKNGFAPATWVDRMLQSGKSSFYRGTLSESVDFSFLPHPLEPSKHTALQTQSTGFTLQNPTNISLAAIKGHMKPLLHNDSASLWDIGDGVACFEFHTKMNAIDADITTLLSQSIDLCQEKFEALLIANESKEAFSAGFNLLLLLMTASQKDWKLTEKAVADFQQVNQKMRYSTIPVVVAPFGLTLGGGTEVSLHGTAVCAHAELYMGLVETGVGLIPAGGGCKEMLGRLLSSLPEDADPFPWIRHIFTTMALAKVSTSAEEAKSLGYLSTRDAISMNRDQLLHHAKQCALGIARSGYRPPRPYQYRLPGYSAYATLRSSLIHLQAAHQITEHDLTVSSALARIVTGGNTSSSVLLTEQHMLDLEREAFLQLCGEEKTIARIEHMLQTGKPLRN